MGLTVPLSHTAELGGSYLSASRLQPPAPTLPPQLSEMEVAGFQYQPLFCERSCHVVGAGGLLCVCWCEEVEYTCSVSAVAKSQHCISWYQSQEILVKMRCTEPVK